MIVHAFEFLRERIQMQNRIRLDEMAGDSSQDPKILTELQSQTLAKVYRFLLSFDPSASKHADTDLIPSEDE